MKKFKGKKGIKMKKKDSCPLVETPSLLLVFCFSPFFDLFDHICVHVAIVLPDPLIYLRRQQRQQQQQTTMKRARRTTMPMLQMRMRRLNQSQPDEMQSFPRLCRPASQKQILAPFMQPPWLLQSRGHSSVQFLSQSLMVMSPTAPKSEPR